MRNNTINSIVKKLEDLLRSEFAKCETVDGNFSSGDQTYHLYKITAPEEYGTLIIARDWFNGLYMAQFECADGKVDIFFGFATKQKDTIRWRYYHENGKYIQGQLDDWFLSEQASKTMTTIIDGTGVGKDGHEGHYFNTIHRKPQNLYGMNADEAVKEIADVYSISKECAKAAIMKQTMLKGDYDIVRFWSGVSIPEPEEDEDGRKEYDNCEDYVNSMSIESLVEIFDNMDCRCDAWCTPSYAIICEIAEAIKKEA
jgi:hypothetical protein